MESLVCSGSQSPGLQVPGGLYGKHVSNYMQEVCEMMSEPREAINFLSVAFGSRLCATEPSLQVVVVTVYLKEKIPHSPFPDT